MLFLVVGQFFFIIAWNGFCQFILFSPIFGLKQPDFREKKMFFCLVVRGVYPPYTLSGPTTKKNRFYVCLPLMANAHHSSRNFDLNTVYSKAYLYIINVNILFRWRVRTRKENMRQPSPSVFFPRSAKKNADRTFLLMGPGGGNLMPSWKY